MDRTVGIVGLGIMGGAIARSLLDHGWRVVGFDTDAVRKNELGLQRALIARDVEETARETPIVMTSLPTPQAVESVAGAIAASGVRDRYQRQHAPMRSLFHLQGSIVGMAESH